MFIAKAWLLVAAIGLSMFKMHPQASKEKGEAFLADLVFVNGWDFFRGVVLLISLQNGVISSRIL